MDSFPGGFEPSTEPSPKDDFVGCRHDLWIFTSVQLQWQGALKERLGFVSLEGLCCSSIIPPQKH